MYGVTKVKPKNNDDGQWDLELLEIGRWLTRSRKFLQHLVLMPLSQK